MDNDIDVSLDGDVLIIRGEEKIEKRDDKETYQFVERSYGQFRRALRLPCPVDPDKVRADFDTGVLTVTLPKWMLPKCKDQEKSRKILVERGRGHGSVRSSDQPNST